MTMTPITEPDLVIIDRDIAITTLGEAIPADVRAGLYHMKARIRIQQRIQQRTHTNRIQPQHTQYTQPQTGERTQ